MSKKTGFTNFKIPILRDTRDNTAHMVFEGEPAAKLHAKNIEIGSSANGNSTQDQVTMERIHTPGSTNY